MENQIPVIITQTFSQPVSVVWKAITDPSEMRNWFFENIEDFDPVVGFETSFMVHTPNNDFLHQWRITEVDLFKKIVYDWSYPDFIGQSFVIWELYPSKKHTTLKLTCTGIESYQKDIPEFSRASCEAGWDFFIRKNLVEYLK